MTEPVQNDRKDLIKLNIPSKPEYVSVVRLTTSAIASRMGFDIEQIDDLKVAIAEACTNALEHGMKMKDENFDIEFEVYNNKLRIVVRDTGEGFATEKISPPDIESLKERGLGIFIIKSLMDEVEIISGNNNGTKIKMVKNLKGDS